MTQISYDMKNLNMQTKIRLTTLSKAEIYKPKAPRRG